MALLSATQGTPERVWSLLTILASHKGEMEREVLSNWLNPKFMSSEEAAPEQNTAVSQTIQAANGLGLIDSSHRTIIRSLIDQAPDDLPTFADIVHEKLVTIGDAESDSVMLEAFAWQAVQTELSGSTEWIDNSSSSAFADAADAALTPPGWSGERRFNSTKLPPWRRWMDLLGLNATLPTGHEYPYVVPRLERVLRSGCMPIDKEIPAAEFMRIVAAKLPYLDGGKLFEVFAKRASLSLPPRTVSRLLSSAMRELVEDSVITLPVRGDSGENYSLSLDPFSRVRSFAGVVVHGVK